MRRKRCVHKRSPRWAPFISIRSCSVFSRVVFFNSVFHLFVDQPFDQIIHFHIRYSVLPNWEACTMGRAINRKEAEEEGDLYRIYEFLFSFSNPPTILHRPCVPARYAIRFVPASYIAHSDVPCEDLASPVIVSSVTSSFSLRTLLFPFPLFLFHPPIVCQLRSYVL